MAAPVLRIGVHAAWAARRRGIDGATIRRVVESPDRVIAVREGREIRQRRFSFPPHGKEYLVRVVLEPKRDTLFVVTVYRTSRMRKYEQAR